MNPVIETRGLTKRYRRVTALSDAAIVVPEGRINGAPIIPSACRTHLSLGAHGIISCAINHGYRGFITYQSGHRYWAFQGIETGIFLLLAAALIAATAIVLLRRDA